MADLPQQRTWHGGVWAYPQALMTIALPLVLAAFSWGWLPGVFFGLIVGSLASALLRARQGYAAAITVDPQRRTLTVREPFRAPDEYAPGQVTSLHQLGYVTLMSATTADGRRRSVHFNTPDPGFIEALSAIGIIVQQQ